MNMPLANFSVLNTRPAHQTHALTEAIQALGGQVVACPTIAIIPLPDLWQQALAPFSCYDLALFTSANAVDCFFANKNLAPWPDTLTTLAIGKSTAHHLQNQAIVVKAIPTMANSETLLAMPYFNDVKEKSILIVKGKDGRDLISNTLKARGAKICEIAVYERTIPIFSLSDLEQIWHKSSIDIILLTSETAIKHLFIMFKNPAHDWLRSKPCLVISKRLADIAGAYGFKKVFITQPDKIVQGLVESRNA